jgi:hypothetical protein
MEDMIGGISVGLGTVLALAHTDFGLAGAALVAIFTMLAVVFERGRSARSCMGSDR